MINNVYLIALISTHYQTNTSFMQQSLLQQLIGDTDIYLLDQIMKNRYHKNDTILDAGCGHGRNLHWFLQNDCCVAYGIDKEEKSILDLKDKYPLLPVNRLQVSSVEKMPFDNNCFDHIISSAVLHFATGTLHFQQMMTEMTRVLKRKGTLFIRMTADIGIENKVELVNDGVYKIPDGSKRFLLTRPLLAAAILHNHLQFLEPMKIVNVNDQRCMSTLLLQKI